MKSRFNLLINLKSTNEFGKVTRKNLTNGFHYVDVYYTEGTDTFEIYRDFNIGGDTGFWIEVDVFVEDLDGDGYYGGPNSACEDSHTASPACEDRVNGADGNPGTADDGVNMNVGKTEAPAYNAYCYGNDCCDNGIDDDCDGEIDEGVKTTWYEDADGDGYGNAAVLQEACVQPVGYVDNSDDCDDGDAAVHPGAREVWNRVDDDCDGEIDEGANRAWSSRRKGWR